MKKVLINADFIDAYTGKLRKAGSKAEMTDERIAEIKSVNPDFVTVIGVVEDKAPKQKPDEDKDSDKGENSK